MKQTAPKAGDAPTKVRQQLHSLTGLRWWASFMVFATHAFAGLIVPEGLFPTPLVSISDVLGFVGVSCFFVLSGFVLTWSRRSSDTAPKFWRRRFFKIYPNHLITLLITVALMLVMGFPITGLIQNLLLVHAWTTDPEVTFSIGVSWSLSVEVFFYLSFPLLIALICKIPPGRLWYWVGGAILADLCVPVAAKLLPDTPLLPWEPTSAIHFWFVYVFPVTRLLEFALGILLARIVMSGRWINVPVWAAWVALTIGCIVAIYLPSLYRVAAATIIPLALLIPALATAEIRGHRSYMSSRVMVWLGNISFAFYLIHSMVLDLVLQGLQYMLEEGFRWTTLSAIGGVTIGLAASVLLSWLLFELVEKPMQRRFSVSRRWAGADQL